MEIAIDLAEAVKLELDAAELSSEFVTRRLYAPSFEPSELQALTISIVPRLDSQSNATRNSCQDEISIDVAVQKYVASIANGLLDPLARFSEEVRKFFNRRKLTNATWAKWVRSSNTLLYGVDHLREKRVWTSVTTLIYKVTGT